MENIFSEFDLDGSGSLTYYEFMKKLRRGGAITKSKEEQAIYLFFKAITKANITIKKAFQIIDMDGSNSISKTEMETAFKKIGIRCDPYTIDAIFKISDGDFDGKINYTELEKLY
jgi:Ca2+-binding EF-hand superfamily protein